MGVNYDNVCAKERLLTTRKKEEREPFYAIVLRNNKNKNAMLTGSDRQLRCGVRFVGMFESVHESNVGEAKTFFNYMK